MRPRLLHDTEDEIEDEQSGFRKSRRTAHNLFILSELICLSKRSHKRLYAAFLDISAAYDYVWRDALWAKLSAAGTHEELLIIIQALYHNTCIAVAIGDLLSQFFWVKQGVRCRVKPRPLQLVHKRPHHSPQSSWHWCAIWQ